MSCPRVGCACPACVVERAVVLLRSGRTAMGLTLLEVLPGRIRRDRAAAAAEVGRLTAEVRSLGAEVRGLGAEVERARRELAGPRPRAKSQAPPAATRPPSRRPMPKLARKPRPHELLAAAPAAGRVDAARVAEILRCDPADVPAIAAGRVALAPSASSRLLDGIANDIRAEEGLP